jgi:hypothetical protein
VPHKKSKTLPLNLQYAVGGEQLLPIFADLIVPKLAFADWGNQAAIQAHAAAVEACTAKVCAELVAGGLDAKSALLGARSFMTFGFAPGFGLGDDYGTEASRAYFALKAWAGARVAAAQAQRRAA